MMKMRKINKSGVIGIVALMALIVLYTFAYWYMDPMRGLGDANGIEIEPFPNEIAVSYCTGGSGGLVVCVTVQNKLDGITYTYSQQSRFNVEKFVDGEWFSVKSQQISGQYALKPIELSDGDNIIIVEWNKNLSPGVYRMIICIDEQRNETYYTTYSDAVIFAI